MLQIKNGLIESKLFRGVKIKKDIIESVGKRNVRRLEKIDGDGVPKGITVHNTGNTSETAGAENHGSYLNNVEKADSGYISWHLTVDSDITVQHLPLNEPGYHAGDGGKGTGNYTTIGIEIAENKNYSQAEKNGIDIICGLMAYYGWGVDKVKPHRYYAKNKKLCPRRILKSEKDWEENWDKFTKRITNRYNELYGNKSEGTVNNGSIKEGSTVKLKSGARQYNGNSIRKDFMTFEYQVKSIKGDRVVLTRNNVVVYAVNIKDIYLVNNTKSSESYLVRITANRLNIRTGPGTNYRINSKAGDRGTVRKGEVYTIIETKGKWGRLKSGAGWISLNYVKKI